MKIICFEENCIYGIEITSYLKKVFPGLVKAYIKCFADNKQEAKRLLENHYGQERYIKRAKKNKRLDFDYDSILLIFNNGKKVEIGISEWGWLNISDNENKE